MFLRVRFNIVFDQSTNLGGMKHQVHPMWKKKCSAKAVNLTADSVATIRMVYKTDFDLYRHAKARFGALLKEGMLSPQIPDLCPKNEQCTKADKVCPHSGCKVPWLDEDVGKEYPCITVGCDPRNHKRWPFK